MGYFDSIYAADLPHRAVALYMYLKDRANADGSCWYAIDTIARQMGLSRSTVKRAIRDLTAHGWLELSPRYRENGSSTSNLITILK